MAAETIEIFSSGSLRGVLAPAIVKEAGLPVGTDLKLTFGAGGRLRERLEKGEHADLFLSADMKAPRMLVAGGHGLLGPIAFARNHMCLLAKPGIEVSADTILDRMLAPDVRLVTSTPVADPGGDYAFAIFDRAEALHPGAAKRLGDKAKRLLGSPKSEPLEGHGAAASIFLRDQADMMIAYCSGAPALQKEVPGLVSVRFPDALDPAPVSGMAIVTDKPAAWKLALFLLSEPGQTLIGDAGYRP